MANFSKISKLRVADDQLAEFVFPVYLDKDDKLPITLICMPGGHHNKGLEAASTKRAQGKRATAGKTPARQLEEGLDEAVLLFPKHVIKGWRNVFDDDGVTPVPYSEAECQKVLELLRTNAPDYFVEFVGWTMTLDNFRVAAAEIVAKN